MASRSGVIKETNHFSIARFALGYRICTEISRQYLGAMSNRSTSRVPPKRLQQGEEKMSTQLSAVLSASLIALSMLVVPAAQCANGIGPDKVVVSTDNGPVRGTVGTTTITFLGIPFAQPPVGELRWRPPGPHGRWHGILEADEFGPHCPQPLTSNQSNSGEDCLFLNVYVPRDLGLERNSASALHSSHVRRPVMVWIYGGANANGASEFYDPTPLVETGGVVAVTVNYRVGPF